MPLRDLLGCRYLKNEFKNAALDATTAKTWYLAVETRQLVALAEQVGGIYSERFKLVKIRRAAGKITDLEVAEASVSLKRAQSQWRADRTCSPAGGCEVGLASQFHTWGQR